MRRIQASVSAPMYAARIAGGNQVEAASRFGGEGDPCHCDQDGGAQPECASYRERPRRWPRSTGSTGCVTASRWR